VSKSSNHTINNRDNGTCRYVHEHYLMVIINRMALHKQYLLRYN